MPVPSHTPAGDSRGEAAAPAGTTYADFLHRKTQRFTAVGVDIDPATIHPMLHPWQREITRWAAQRGRAAIFADCGLGKTFMQVEWARLVATGRTALIVAPLTVARQTEREAAKLGLTVPYIRSGEQITGPGVYITNYEMVRHFDPADITAVVLDESSILKAVDGKTRTFLIGHFADVPYRLACTATPAPNDVAELTNHAEFLGVASRAEMLAAYFVHDDDGWRLKGHATEAMYRWMASWAVAIRKPSDLGHPDTGYVLPPLTIIPQVVTVDGLDGLTLGGVSGRATVRKATLAARVARTVTLAQGDDQWIIWCGLNAEAEQATAGIAGAVNVVGSWTPEAKAEAIEAFQAGEIRVLVTKPSIAGFGLNFQQCSRMVFLGLSDSYEAYYQSIRRCWRFGQTDPVDAHVVLSTLESPIADNVARKEQESGHITDRLIAYNTLTSAEGAAA